MTEELESTCDPFESVRKPTWPGETSRNLISNCEREESNQLCDAEIEVQDTQLAQASEIPEW